MTDPTRTDRGQATRRRYTFRRAMLLLIVALVVALAVRFVDWPDGDEAAAVSHHPSTATNRSSAPSGGSTPTAPTASPGAGPTNVYAAISSPTLAAAVRGDPEFV